MLIVLFCFFRLVFFFFFGHLAVNNSLCKSDTEGRFFYGKDIKKAFITFFVLLYSFNQI